MRVDLCSSISAPWNRASLPKMYQKEWDSRLAQKIYAHCYLGSRQLSCCWSDNFAVQF
jgi:hypothetical protein